MFGVPFVGMLAGATRARTRPQDMVSGLGAHRDVGGGGGSVSNGEREERERQDRGVGEGRSSGERLRYTVEEAAAVLGMTTGAVRNRLSQGTLRSVEEHGTVYVLLPADTAPDAPRDTAQDSGDIPGEFLLPADTAPDAPGIPHGIPATYQVCPVHSCPRCASG